MNKSYKGALAAGAAGTLLLGGAGSLAYWNSTATADSGAITSGTLGLTGVGCDSAWKYNGGTADGTTVVLVVPGDSITKSCTFTVAATGDHLSATLAAPSTVAYTKTPATATSDKLTVATTYAINRATTASLVNGDKITSTDNTKTITAKFVVTMPFGTAPGATNPVNVNDTQGLTATLNALTVTATQDSLGSNPNA